MICSNQHPLALRQGMLGDLTAAMRYSPEVLFLDEATIGLEAEAKIDDIIRTIYQQGISPHLHS